NEVLNCYGCAHRLPLPWNDSVSPRIIQHFAWTPGCFEQPVESRAESRPSDLQRFYAFVLIQAAAPGNLRMGLIACHHGAAECRHKEIELAAHELLQYLAARSARGR